MDGWVHTRSLPPLYSSPQYLHCQLDWNTDKLSHRVSSNIKYLQCRCFCSVWVSQVTLPVCYQPRAAVSHGGCGHWWACKNWTERMSGSLLTFTLYSYTINWEGKGGGASFFCPHSRAIKTRLTFPTWPTQNHLRVEQSVCDKFSQRRRGSSHGVRMCTDVAPSDG